MKVATLALLLPLVLASPYPQKIRHAARDDAVSVAASASAAASSPAVSASAAASPSAAASGTAAQSPQAAPAASGQSPVGAEPGGVEAVKALVKRRLPEK